ncbi:MAG TPA: GNAT family N-acetyltransferase [Candidatus Angelobacter sp.]|nr:GNAT family N-acetyltransferase [Candidatus Angelobacter sp.]
MEIDVRSFDGEARQFFDAGELAFGDRARDEDFEAFESLFEPDRAVGAFDGDRLVGTAGTFSFDLTVPGGVARSAGVTLVGVLPTHRRRGVLRRMMELQLQQIHERGEATAILWASEGSIYQRFGYGLGNLLWRLEVERERSAFRRPHVPAGTVRFVELDEARRLLPPVHDAIAPTRAGFFARSPAYWDAEIFRDPEHWRRGAGPAFYVVHETKGTVDGYARYRIRESWNAGGPRSTVVLTEKLATNPAADLDLWRYLLGIDLMASLDAWNVAPDDPIVLNALEPRRLGMALGDALWLRVVDVPSALAQRRYAMDGRLVLDMADEHCGWNAGRWSLRVEGGLPLVEPTSDAPDLVCDVADLGAVYLGGFGFSQLAAAGRVQEAAPGGLDRADAMFRTARPPWCPRVF